VKLNFIILTLITVSFFITGCNEQQLADANNIAGTAVTVSDAIGGVLTSPAGGVVPVDWRLWGLLVTNIVSATGNIFQKWNRDRLTTVAKAIVTAIDRSPVAESVKTEIKSEMQDREILALGNVVVEQLKNG